MRLAKVGPASGDSASESTVKAFTYETVFIWQADPSRSHVEGVGVGLSMAKWIAKSHLAKLTVACKLDEGTISDSFFLSAEEKINAFDPSLRDKDQMRKTRFPLARKRHPAPV